ncbi:MAG: class I SAM-dependent methyltransferase [Woeseiaceae bacterium]
MTKSAKFWDRLAMRYSKRPVADEASYQKKLQITREYLEPNMEVLEFGCGTGSTAITHAPFVKHILAIDISSKMIEIAKGKADTNAIDNVTFRRASIDEFDAPEQGFDAVLGLSILHLVENRDEIIAKAYKMLRPNGIFVTSTACLGDTMKFFKIVAPIGRFFGLMPTLKVFTSQQLQDSITNAGFQIEHHWQPGKGQATFIVAQKLVT